MIKIQFQAFQNLFSPKMRGLGGQKRPQKTFSHSFMFLSQISQMELTLIATMVLSVINITGGKKHLIISSIPLMGPYLSPNSVGFTLPLLSHVTTKKCGMVRIKEIIVPMHI